MQRYRVTGAWFFLIGAALVLADSMSQNSERRETFNIQPGHAASYDLAIQEEETVNSETTVSVIRVEGAIGPTVSNYVSRGLQLASDRGDAMLIIELDTPGGMLNVTQDIVQMLLGSDLPVAVYVSPEGANAGSAGTFITMAAHVAAMAPATNIGAASPVQMTGGQMDSVMQKKIFSYTESFIESIAEARNRNVEWAKSAVRDGASITSREAAEINVIDFLASDLPDLLDQMHGFEIKEHKLETRNAEIIRIEPNLAERFFSIIFRPEVLLILTMVSIYGILGEISNPGAIIPGVAGVISLILLLFGVAAMPINVAGFLLIGLALILFIMEAFTPTYGVLLAGGGVSFFLGALMLFQDFPAEMKLSLTWIIPATLLTVLFFAWVVYFGIRAQFGEKRSGIDIMIGRACKVVDRVDLDNGRIFLDGEYWNARSEIPIKKGETCEITAVQGLTLQVRPVEKKH